MHGIVALQCAIRTHFATRPPNRALAESLEEIGKGLDARYVVVHARSGAALLSEEWASANNSELDQGGRDIVHQELWETVSAERARCCSIDTDGNGHRDLLITAVVHDANSEVTGGGAVLLPVVDEASARLRFVEIQGLLGHLALLIDTTDNRTTRNAERPELQHSKAANHPLQLADGILAELESRYGVELAAVGFVRRNRRVEIASVTGLDQVRGANPGISTVRAAMEECFDRGEIIVADSRIDAEVTDECRLHKQWSRAAGGNTTASFPLVFMGETLGIVSLSEGGGARLSREQVQVIAEEMSGYAALLPLSMTATRNLRQHALDVGRDVASRWLGGGRTRAILWSISLILLAAWTSFGSLPHSVTVPCIVKARERRTIACPRSGVLAELFVLPGDRVHEGQLLAAIDASDDFLQRAELDAEIKSLAALIDQAVADRDAGRVRVHRARQRSLEAQLAIVDASIAQAQIIAPQDGMILEGDMRDQLGSRLQLGTPLFELASFDRASVKLHVPEALVLDVRGNFDAAEFASNADPTHSFPIAALSIAPASAVVDGHNVFIGDAEISTDLGELPPGVEGTAQIHLGSRPVLWVLTHRITDWLYLHFWL